MKKLLIVLVTWVIGYAGFFQAITCAIVIAQVDSLNKLEPMNYLLGRYVIGSGGIIGATSVNQRHHATVGQSIVGGMQGTNNILLSGFWRPAGKPVEIQATEPIALPTEFKLYQNYPNPFNPETIIEYDLPQASLVMIEIFNTVGQRIRLVSSQILGPGYATSVWDGRNDQGEAMGSGVYFYRMTALALDEINSGHQIQFQQTKEMVLVK